MAAKQESKHDLDTLDDKDGEEDSGRSLVMHMCEFAFKVLNDEMDGFFEDNVDAFEQEDGELFSGRGETLEQYNVFKKYESELERRFDSFALKEGFTSSKACFDAVKDAVVADSIAQREMMEKLMRRLRDAQQALQNQAIENREDKAEAKESRVVASSKQEKKSKKTDDDDEEDGDENGRQGGGVDMAPLMMFFQPISLENLVQTTLSIADYRTFSYIMRMKVKQIKLFRDMEKKVELQSEKSSIRRKQLKGNKNLVGYFEEFVERLCDLTPNRPDVIAYTRSIFPIKRWETLMDSDIENPDTQKDFKEFTGYILQRLSQMGTIEDMQALRKHTTDLATAIDVMDGTMQDLGARVLQTAHDFIDRTEVKVLEILKAQRDKRSSGGSNGSEAKPKSPTRAAVKGGDDDGEK